MSIVDDLLHIEGFNDCIAKRYGLRKGSGKYPKEIDEKIFLVDAADIMEQLETRIKYLTKQLTENALADYRKTYNEPYLRGQPYWQPTKEVKGEKE